MPVATRCLSLVVLAAISAAAPAAEIAVQATRDGDAIEVVAVAEFRGDIPGAWRVLTDYGRIAEYVPSLDSSRVISRGTNSAVVEQKGEARVLFFSFPLNVLLAITEYPFRRVESRAVAGSFREMRNVYTLEARQGRVLLRYSGVLVPDFAVPPLVGTWLLRRNVEETFRALVAEIERQHKPVNGER